jgi:phage/plasmid-like protein (TIGR03299 family)
MHNLNFNNQLGRHAFASVKELPWHGLGVIVDNPMTSMEAIQQGGIDYTVEKRPVYVHHDLGGGNTMNSLVPGAFATVRMDNMNPLGIVGSKYAVIQNRECFKFFDTIVGEGMAMFETVGALGGGERVFITAKLPDSFVVGDDVIDQYLFLTNTHTGREGLIVGFTPTRIVCNNTLNIALGNAMKRIKIRHTLNYDERLSEAAKMMGVVKKISETTAMAMRKMCDARISDETTLDLIHQILNPGGLAIDDMGVRKKVGAITERAIFDCYDYTLNHTTQASIRGTVWGFVNGITGYHQNIKEYKTPGQKVADLTHGLGARRNRRAFQVAEKMI